MRIYMKEDIPGPNISREIISSGRWGIPLLFDTQF